MNFTNKGIELEMTYADKISRAFKFDMSFNIATYRNRVNYIDGVAGTYIPGGSYGSGGEHLPHAERGWAPCIQFLWVYISRPVPERPGCNGSRF